MCVPALSARYCEDANQRESESVSERESGKESLSVHVDYRRGGVPTRVSTVNA